MKTPILLLLSCILAATSATAGSSRAVPINPNDLARQLGIDAAAFEFCFDEPVHCKITFQLRDPSFAETRVHSTTSVAPSKTMRAAYSIIRPASVANQLGLSVQGHPNTKYHFSVGSVSPDSTSGLSAAYTDPIAIAYTSVGLGVPPESVALDTDVIIFGQFVTTRESQPNFDAVKAMTAKQFLDHERCVLITVRFQATIQ